VPIHLEVITPERKVYDDDVDMVIAPGSEGYLGILPHHAPLLTGLGPGEFRVKKGGVEEVLAVFGGFMDVRGDRVVVLTDAAEPAEEIDAQRAQQARDRAQEQLAQAGTLSAADEARARVALQRALVRIRVSERRRRTRS
jgi:F-type H+-transporting ATPase subunit epsilon